MKKMQWDSWHGAVVCWGVSWVGMVTTLVGVILLDPGSCFTAGGLILLLAGVVLGQFFLYVHSRDG